MGQIGLTGTATVDASGVRLSAKMNPTKVTANVFIYAKEYLTDRSCIYKLYDDKELFNIGSTEDLGSVTVYTF